MSPRDFMRLAGVIEMVVGALILSGRTRLGGYIAGAWLLRSLRTWSLPANTSMLPFAT